MLDSLRNASRTLAAKLLLLLLVVSFGIWGVSASLVSSNSHAVMTVGDQTVTPNQFRFAYQRQMAEIGQQFGTRLTTEQARAFGIDRQVFSQLAAGASLDQLAENMKLGLSEDRLVNLIAEDPAFKSPGASSTASSSASVCAAPASTRTIMSRNAARSLSAARLSTPSRMVLHHRRFWSMR